MIDSHKPAQNPTSGHVLLALFAIVLVIVVAFAAARVKPPQRVTNGDVLLPPIPNSVMPADYLKQTDHGGITTNCVRTAHNQIVCPPAVLSSTQSVRDTNGQVWYFAKDNVLPTT